MIQQKILSIDLLASSKRHHPVSTVLHCNCNNIACQFLLVFLNHWCQQNVGLLSNYLHSYSWWNPPSLCCYIFDTVHIRILIMQLKSNTNMLAQVECQCYRLHITSIIYCAHQTRQHISKLYHLLCNLHYCKCKTDIWQQHW